MHFSSFILLATAGLAVQAATIPSHGLEDAITKRDFIHRRRAMLRRQDERFGGGQNGGGGGNNNDGGASPTCLAANAVQSASAETGQDGEIAAGQVESKT